MCGVEGRRKEAALPVEPCLVQWLEGPGEASLGPRNREMVSIISHQAIGDDVNTGP